MNRKFSFKQAGSLSRQLSQRVLLLSLVALLGLLALVGVGLQSSFQSTQNRLILAKDTAHNTFIRFLGVLTGDLQATSDALTTTKNVDDVFRRTLERQPAIFELTYVNTVGQVIDQRRRVGQGELSFTEQPWLETVKSGQTYISSVDYGEFGVPFITIALPVTEQDGNFKGTLLAITDLTALWRPVISSQVGETGYVYIADDAGKLLAFRDLALVQSGADISAITGRTPQTIAESSTNVYPGVGGSLAVAVGQSLDIVPWFVIVEQPVSEALRTFAWLAVILALLLIFVGMQAINIRRFTQRRIVEPLSLLQEGVKELQGGHLERPIHIETKDELGDLADTFNSMAIQLGELIGTLEQRVADRTKALTTSSEVSRRISTILDQKELVSEVVNQVKNAFGYYHTQIYFYDEANENLVMAGGTGEAGEKMLAQFHKVAKGIGLVGRAAESNRAVLVSDTSKDPEWLPNVLLPETESEAAIPISIGDQLLGILDVQHNVTNGLQQEDVDLLQSIANQIAVALQNIRQYGNTQKIAADMGVVANVGIATSTITDAGHLLQAVVDLSKESFNLYHAHIYLLNEAGNLLELASGAGEVGRQMVSEKRSIPLDSEQSLVARAARTREGVVVNDVTVDPTFLSNPLLPETRSEMAVPMLVAGKVIGVLDVQSETTNRFTEVDVSIQTTLASQVAVALQNASSFSQTQQQAERETKLNLITQKIQSTTSIEAALQIAARELGHALGMKSTLVALDPEALTGEQKVTRND